MPEKSVTILPTKDVVVIAWIRGDVISLPTAPDLFQQLVADLNSPLFCSDLLAEWAVGLPSSLFSDSDIAYANAFLIKFSANDPPPNTMNPASEEADGDFRLFNRLKIAYRVREGKVVGAPKFLDAKTIVGKTPDPCGIIPPVGAESDVANGAKGITTSEEGVFQVNQGRIGTLGQAVDTTLNDRGGDVGETTPWVWSVIKFGLDGESIFPFSIGSKQNHSAFPTLNVYEDGSLKTVINQGSHEAFIAGDDSSKIAGVIP